MCVCVCVQACVCLCAHVRVHAYVFFQDYCSSQQSNLLAATNCMISSSTVLNPMENELNKLCILNDPQFLRNQKRNNSKSKESTSCILRGRGSFTRTDPRSALCSLTLSWPRDDVARAGGCGPGNQCRLALCPQLSAQIV